MKKMTALLLVLWMISSLAACAGESTSSSSTPILSTVDSSSEVSSEPAATREPTPTPEPTATAAPPEESETEPDTGTKVLVAYFSATGNTRPLAEYMANGLGADLYEIVPEEPYTEADLNYNDSGSRTSIEMNDPDSRPAISGSVENMEQYDVVFIGYPIWWGQAPKIISTFLESYDWSGKIIVPFCTSGSSSIGSSASNLESLTSGAEWLSGRRFSGSASQDELLGWADSLDLNLN